METIIIDALSAGTRIDAHLAKTLPEYTRGDIVRGLKNETILCNEKKTKPSYKLQEGDTLTYTALQSHNTELIPNETIPLTVVDEQPDFIIIEKQRGLQAHPSTTEREETLANALIAHYPEIKEVGDDPLRPGIMHRLDKFTSGLMVIARNQETFEKLKEAFGNRTVHKTYKTLVWGELTNPEGSIDAPIARAVGYTRQKVVLDNTGRYKGEAKDAITEYSTDMTFEAPFFVSTTRDADIKTPRTIKPKISLITAHPLTGRMHQIRVHMRHIGHPIVGDIKYENKPVRDLNQQFFDGLDPKVMHTFYLHATKLAFTLDGTEHSYTSELPTYFTDVLPST